MIDLKCKNILCNTKEELEAILKEAKNQKITWCTGRTVNIDDFDDIIPVVLCFITDLAKDLLNQDREMTAHEFLNKFLDMAYHCSNCEECKTIKANGCDYRWCDSDLWTKDNIDQVYEIVKTGNKQKEKPKQAAINNISNYLDGIRW